MTAHDKTAHDLAIGGATALSRRDLIKASAVAATAAAAGLPSSDALAQAATAGKGDGIRWDKGVCRFCGTGCGVIVGTKNGRVVATQGDPDAPVNRGLNCIKGYFLSKIMYGQDRLTQPLLRKKNGKYDKNGDFTPVSWDEAFQIMAEKFKAALKASGPTAILCMYTHGPGLYIVPRSLTAMTAMALARP